MAFSFSKSWIEIKPNDSKAFLSRHLLLRFSDWFFISLEQQNWQNNLMQIYCSWRNVLWKSVSNSLDLALVACLMIAEYILTWPVWPVKSRTNVYKSCPKMISPEKWKILTPIQKLPESFKSCRKCNKSLNLVTLARGALRETSSFAK